MTTLPAYAETVSVVLLDGDVREDWPDPGAVAVRRTGTTGDLIVNFSLGGTASHPADYTPSSANSVTISDGEQEAWVDFAPTGSSFGSPFRTIEFKLQSGSGYDVDPKLNTALITIETVSNTPSLKAAIRFLNQAAFGANNDLRNAREVVQKGYEGWIEDQFRRPLGLHQPYLTYLKRVRKGRVYGDSKAISWWNRVMEVPAAYPGAPARAGDPLRQRMAFALSEIFVISDWLDELNNQPLGMANYYDMLVRGAFGNYRDLLYKVGTHPCMGVYLTHLQNEKGDPDAGTFADENFAREIMQLFSIGLWELNPDGTRKLDQNQEPIATYNNTTIANMARVMTGFSFGGPKANDFWYSPENFTAPMHMYDEYHDVGAKTIIGGINLPARTPSDPDTGAAGLADYNAAIDALFNHPNTPPFISQQLIQRFVTSNPSPAYVGRVAAVFANNGSGVRGDLRAVLKAILLDQEARDPAKIGDAKSGRMKEPYLRTVNLVRALGAKPGNGTYDLRYLYDIHFQAPQSAPSVFNFFKPGYAPDGVVTDNGMVAPEFQILNSVTAIDVPNYYFDSLVNGFNRYGSSNPRALVRPGFKVEIALATDPAALVRRLDLILTGGTLPNAQHQIIREAIEKISADIYQWKLERVRMAAYLIATSPEFGVLR